MTECGPNLCAAGVGGDEDWMCELGGAAPARASVPAEGRERWPECLECDREEADRLALEAHLTRKECEVFRFLLQGLSIKQISATTGIGFQTIAKHRRSVLQRFKAANDVDLVLKVLSVRLRLPRRTT
ncbi:MAG: hypothetical protein KF774_21180 [Planctomyces sp.]|nr:hypothetical protein [Planctomyces sp.]